MFKNMYLFLENVWLLFINVIKKKKRKAALPLYIYFIKWIRV